MTEKRTYCADNPQDVKELWPRIDSMFDGVRFIDDFKALKCITFWTESKSFGLRAENLSFRIDFCSKDRIERPVEIKIGQFGKFWDFDCEESEDSRIFGFLTKINEGEYAYYNHRLAAYKHFTPITPESEEWEKICKAVKGE